MPTLIVTGRLEQRSWEDREGQKRSVVEVAVDDVGPSLRGATAVVTRRSPVQQPIGDRRLVEDDPFA